MPIIQLASKILPVILLIGVGLLLKRSSFISEKTVAELKKFVVNLALPCLLFNSFLNTKFQASHIWIIASIFLINIVMLGIGKFLGLIAAKDNPFFPLAFTGFEMGMLGFSLFGAVYGVGNLGVMGVLDLGQEIYVWFLMTTLLSRLGKEGFDFKKTLLSFIKSPVIIGILLGVVLNLVGLKSVIATNALTNGILYSISMLSQLTIPLILIVIGYQLNLRLKDFKLPLLTLMLRLSALLAFAFVINAVVFVRFLHLPRFFSVGLFTMFILPPPFIMPLFIDDAHPESSYVANTLSLGTLLSLAGFIVVVAVFGV